MLLASLIRQVVQDERGIETLEWILIGALIAGVGAAVYPGTLTGQLTGAITAVGGYITAQVP